MHHPAAPRTFANPIVRATGPAGSADPSIVHRDGWYYYCRSIADGALGIARARRLQDIGHAEMMTVWRPPPGTAFSQQIWAPELQRIHGRWYIYFAASDGDNRSHRMYVLQAQTDDPMGGWTFIGKVAPAEDRWAIDGIAIENAGALYFMWSGWRYEDDGFPQVLFLAPMGDPWTISGERVEIAAPEQPWEQHGAPLLEGPAVLYRGGRIHITYSAGASWTDHYALGLLSYSSGDILSPASWSRSATPVFAQHPQLGVFGPGHNSFVTSPDGLEDWLVYHAIESSGGGWLQRSVRAQPFGWTDHGNPDFGMPVAPGLAIAEPSGSPVWMHEPPAAIEVGVEMPALRRRKRPARALEPTLSV